MVKIKIVQEDPSSFLAYSRTNSITTLASGVGNVREPDADVIRKRIARIGLCVCVCVCVNVFLHTRTVEVPVFVHSRSSCKHMTEVGKSVRRALKIVT